MKQNILTSDSKTEMLAGPCVFRMVMIWAVFGLIALAAWQAAGGDQAGRALVWAAALFAGLALATKLWSTRP